ncbi:MAG: hypothetical protein NTW19_14425 [Planctomycetota bacterium]|nr:hypothetical protein [Planctomycetota bacterium]
MAIKAKMEMTVDVLIMFKPEFEAQQGGSFLAMDSNGGIGISAMSDDSFRGQKRPVFWGNFGMSFYRDAAGWGRFERGGKAKAPDGKVAMGPQWQKDFGEVTYRLKTGQELWVSVFPRQQPMDAKAYEESIGKQENPYEIAFPDPKTMSPEAYAAARAKRGEALSKFNPHPGNDIRRMVNIPGFFHQAGLLKDIRTSVEIQGNLYRNGGMVHFAQTNPRKEPLPVTLKWEAPGWKVTPAEVKLKPEPGALAEADFAFAPASAGPAPVFPAPRLVATYELPGVDGKPVTMTQMFGVPANETTDVPRLPALSGLDAVAEALKEQKPRVIHSDGDTYTEIRRPEGGPSTDPLMRLVGGAGDSAAEIRLAVAGDSLAFSAKITDPRCLPEVAKWSGPEFGMAGLDLYVSGIGSTKIRQFHFQALTPTGDKNLIFNENGKKAGDPTYPCRIVPIKPFGYEVHALIPLKDCLLEPGVDKFLVDAALLGKNRFNLLYTGEPSRCGYRNNRYFGMAIVQPAAGK